MDNKSFDDILKQSMDTPRDFEFDEGAWERMEERLPSSKRQFSGWLKYLPFTVAILGLMGWNFSLQRQLHTMKMKPWAVQQVDTVVKKEYVYQVDTIYQIQEKNIHHYIHYQTDEKTTQNVHSSSFDNTFGNATSSNSQSFSKKENIDFSINDVNDKNDNSIFSTKNTNNTFSELFQKKSTFDNILNVNNSQNFSSQNISDVTYDVENEAITSLKSLPFSTLNSQKLNRHTNIIEDIVTNNTAHQKKSNQQKRNRLKELSREIGAKEFTLGVNSSTFVTTGSSLSGAVGYNLHGGMRIFRDISIETYFGRMFGTSDHYAEDFFAHNPYPHVDHSQLPANATLLNANVYMNYWQLALGVRKTWHRQEHIRPYLESGWVVMKPTKGEVGYAYSVDNEDFIFHTFDVNSSNTNLHWNGSPVYFGTGLSSQLLKNRIILDFGIKYMIGLNPQKGLYTSNVRDAVGVDMSFSYQFGKRKRR